MRAMVHGLRPPVLDKCRRAIDVVGLSPRASRAPALLRSDRSSSHLKETALRPISAGIADLAELERPARLAGWNRPGECIKSSRAPDPLGGVDYTGGEDDDSRAELDVLHRGGRERRPTTIFVRQIISLRSADHGHDHYCSQNDNRVVAISAVIRISATFTGRAPMLSQTLSPLGNSVDDSATGAAFDLPGNAFGPNVNQGPLPPESRHR
ncbi:hypothetical protein [Amycolatopsis sp. lyj-108]|uniref:hypothetical protein n=1 Tax=Amycolatopsis sp. lyj-108 TaxID=2789286 RepID=UPI00397DA541